MFGGKLYSLVGEGGFSHRMNPAAVYTTVMHMWLKMTGFRHKILRIIGTNSNWGAYEMHDTMHPNYCQITILLVVDLCSSLAYFMMTHPLTVAGKLPIKTLVARQLPTKRNTCRLLSYCLCNSIINFYYVIFIMGPADVVNISRCWNALNFEVHGQC